jgi:gentisate 1,2-dioxygenase
VSDLGIPAKQKTTKPDFITEQPVNSWHYESQKADQEVTWHHRCDETVPLVDEPEARFKRKIEYESEVGRLIRNGACQDWARV